MCAPVDCPEHSRPTGTTGECTCNEGFKCDDDALCMVTKEKIVWNLNDENWIGTCVDLDECTVYGDSLTDLYPDCASGEDGCLNTFGDFMCVPTGIDRSVQWVSTNPQIVKFNFTMRGTFEIGIDHLSYGPSEELDRFRCTHVEVTPFFSSGIYHYSLKCALEDETVGNNLRFSWNTGWTNGQLTPVLSDLYKENTFASQAPLFLLGTLQEHEQGSGGTPNLNVELDTNGTNAGQSKALTIQMEVAYFTSRIEFIQVHYCTRTDPSVTYNNTCYSCGSESSPNRVSDSTTADLLVCTLSSPSVGIFLKFYANVAGQLATSVDTVSFPLAPIIETITGCGPQGCPTSGNVLITIHGW